MAQRPCPCPMCHASTIHRLSCGACARVQILGRVAGVLKMTGKSEAEKNKPLRGEAGTGAEVVATLEFAPPIHVRWARFDAAGRTTFISAFYASPAGALPWRAGMPAHGSGHLVVRSRWPWATPCMRAPTEVLGARQRHVRGEWDLMRAVEHDANVCFQPTTCS